MKSFEVYFEVYGKIAGALGIRYSYINFFF